MKKKQESKERKIDPFDLEEILIDHAFCEQKAASNSISIIVQYPQYPDLVESMVEICKEEMEHFKMVHDKIKERGFQLGFERKDPYVKDLSKSPNMSQRVSTLLRSRSHFFHVSNH